MRVAFILEVICTCAFITDLATSICISTDQSDDSQMIICLQTKEKDCAKTGKCELAYWSNGLKWNPEKFSFPALDSLNRWSLDPLDFVAVQGTAKKGAAPQFPDYATLTKADPTFNVSQKVHWDKLHPTQQKHIAQNEDINGAIGYSTITKMEADKDASFAERTKLAKAGPQSPLDLATLMKAEDIVHITFGDVPTKHYPDDYKPTPGSVEAKFPLPRGKKYKELIDRRQIDIHIELLKVNTASVANAVAISEDISSKNLLLSTHLDLLPATVELPSIFDIVKRTIPNYKAPKDFTDNSDSTTLLSLTKAMAKKKGTGGASVSRTSPKAKKKGSGTLKGTGGASPKAKKKGPGPLIGTGGASVSHTIPVRRRTLWGRDTRQVVRAAVTANEPDISQHPYRSIGSLWMYKRSVRDGSHWQHHATAWLISDRHIVTNGHVVMDSRSQTPFPLRDMIFTPSYTGTPGTEGADCGDAHNNACPCPAGRDCRNPDGPNRGYDHPPGVGGHGWWWKPDEIAEIWTTRLWWDCGTITFRMRVGDWAILRLRNPIVAVGHPRMDFGEARRLSGTYGVWNAANNRPRPYIAPRLDRQGTAVPGGGAMAPQSEQDTWRGLGFAGYPGSWAFNQVTNIPDGGSWFVTHDNRNIMIHHDMLQGGSSGSPMIEIRSGTAFCLHAASHDLMPPLTNYHTDAATAIALNTQVTGSECLEISVTRFNAWCGILNGGGAVGICPAYLRTRGVVLLPQYHDVRAGHVFAGGFAHVRPFENEYNNMYVRNKYDYNNKKIKNQHKLQSSGHAFKSYTYEPNEYRSNEQLYHSGFVSTMEFVSFMLVMCIVCMGYGVIACLCGCTLNYLYSKYIQKEIGKYNNMDEMTDVTV